MKKILAIFCALGMMTTLAACGEQENSSSEAATTAATTEAITEATTEATTEAATETTTEETTEETTTAEEETTTTDGETVGAEVDASALAAELTQTETVDSFSLNVSPNWTKDESLGYPMWYLEDETGAFFVQEFDTAEMGISSDMDHKTALEAVGGAMETQATVIADEWDTVNGEDAYGMTYTMDAGGVSTTNISIFFYVGDTICGVTFTDFGGTGTIINYAQPILDTITF